MRESKSRALPLGYSPIKTWLSTSGTIRNKYRFLIFKVLVGWGTWVRTKVSGFKAQHTSLLYDTSMFGWREKSWTSDCRLSADCTNRYATRQYLVQVARVALTYCDYQPHALLLSYTWICLVAGDSFELPTPCSSGTCSTNWATQPFLN